MAVGSLARPYRLGRRTVSARRRGAVLVELAVWLPLIATLVFGGVEACGMIFLKQALQTAAYEAARAAVASEFKGNQALPYARKVLAARNIVGATISLTPAKLNKVDVGEPITVVVRAPIEGNRLLPAWFFGGGNLTVRCTMLKEYPRESLSR